MAQSSFIKANQGVLFAESVSLEAIAKQFGTPTYVYSKNTLIQTFESFKKEINFQDCEISKLKYNLNLIIKGDNF